jgi:hypothetical protein
MMKDVNGGGDRSQESGVRSQELGARRRELDEQETGGIIERVTKRRQLDFSEARELSTCGKGSLVAHL